MATKDKPNKAASLFAKGDILEVGEGEHKRKYRVLPMTLKEVLGSKDGEGEFLADNLSLGAQGFNILVPEAREKVDKWMKRKLRDEKDEPMSLERAVEDGWDFEDVRNFLAKLAGLSG